MLDLAVLSDRIEIGDLLTRYTRAIDTGDWDRLDTVFLPDARIDYSATGGLDATYPEVKAWLAKMLPLFPQRQHLLGQVDATIDGDAATVVAYFVNPMVVPGADGGADALWEFGGLYHHALVRTDAGWRSRELVEELIWKRGMPG